MKYHMACMLQRRGRGGGGMRMGSWSASPPSASAAPGRQEHHPRDPDPEVGRRDRLLGDKGVCHMLFSKRNGLWAWVSFIVLATALHPPPRKTRVPRLLPGGGTRIHLSAALRRHLRKRNAKVAHYERGPDPETMSLENTEHMGNTVSPSSLFVEYLWVWVSWIVLRVSSTCRQEDGFLHNLLLLLALLATRAKHVCLRTCVLVYVVVVYLFYVFTCLQGQTNYGNLCFCTTYDENSTKPLCHQ